MSMCYSLHFAVTNIPATVSCHKHTGYCEVKNALEAKPPAISDLQAEAEVDSLMEQVSQEESKIRSPFKRRAGLTDEEMGMPPERAIVTCMPASTLPLRDA